MQSEQLDSMVTMLRLKVANLEQRCLRCQSADQRYVAELAHDLGMGDEEELWARRPEIARELKRRGWSAWRVARALGVCERTVGRWNLEARS